MNQICLMKNTIQPYAWGSHTAIAALLGEPAPSHHPQAELWMGAHPKATSQIWYQGRWQGLDLLIEQYPVDVLGQKVNARFDKKLPFLFKVLAAEQPLSIQAHPDKTQARTGYRREDESGIPLDAPHRNYKDGQHKPECLCALTTFWGLCGFRTIPEMMVMLGSVWPSDFNSALTLLTKKGIKAFFQFIMTLTQKPRTALVDQVVQNMAGNKQPNDVSVWINRLYDNYGSDIGVLSPIFLNLVKLAPGQAIFLPAGQLHAYLDGVGIELMANSDNVLRGGLTPKHMDVPELLNVLDFKPRMPKILEGGVRNTGERIYPSPAEEFFLSLIEISDRHPFSSEGAAEVPAIVLCTEGNAVFQWQEGAQRLDLTKGQSVFVPASVAHYSITGNATLYRASVNL